MHRFKDYASLHCISNSLCSAQIYEYIARTMNELEGRTKDETRRDERTKPDERTRRTNERTNETRRTNERDERSVASILSYTSDSVGAALETWISYQIYGYHTKRHAILPRYFLRYYAYLTSQMSHFLFHGYFSHILHFDIIKSEINLDTI